MQFNAAKPRLKVKTFIIYIYNLSLMVVACVTWSVCLVARWIVDSDDWDSAGLQMSSPNPHRNYHCTPHMLMLIFNETHHVTFQCLMISTCFKCAVSWVSWKAQTCQNYQMISWWKYARVTCGCVTADRPLESHLTTNNPPAPVSVWTQRGCQRNFTIFLLLKNLWTIIL